MQSCGKHEAGTSLQLKEKITEKDDDLPGRSSYWRIVSFSFERGDGELARFAGEFGAREEGEQKLILKGLVRRSVAPPPPPFEMGREGGRPVALQTVARRRGSTPGQGVVSASDGGCVLFPGGREATVSVWR